MHSELAAMESNELLDERETDAGAFVAARMCALDAVEAFEDARQVLLTDADARIRHFELYAVWDLAQAHRDAPFERELERVRQEIQDNLLPHVPVDVECLGERRAVDVEREVRSFEGRAEIARKV